MLITSKHRKVEKSVKKVHKGLRKKNKKVKELHAYHENETTRKRVLKNIAKIDELQILCVVLNKSKVHTKLKDQKVVLYNYVTNILLDRLKNSGVLDDTSEMEICIDQKETNKFMNDNFLCYLRNATNHWNKNKVMIRLAHSHNEKCLQAVDFVSWAIFRKYECGDYDYYNLIQDKIIEENFLFK